MRGDFYQPDLLPSGLAKVLHHNRLDATVIQMTFPGTPEAVRLALQDLIANPLLSCLSRETNSNAEIVLAEALNNIVEHAYAQIRGEITLSIEPVAQGLRCEITDRGAPMPGLRLPDGLFQSLDQIADLPEGGFGWFLIRSLTEGLEYRRINGVNRLSFQLPCGQSGN